MCAAKDRDWQIGRVLDQQARQGAEITTIDTNSAQTNRPGLGDTRVENRSSTTQTTSAAMVNQLLIQGAKYRYVIENPEGPTRGQKVVGGLIGRRATSRRGSSCRFVIGEDIKYAQDRGVLHILDADGRECQMEILRQETIH